MDKAPECPWELTVWDVVVQETQDEALNSQPSLDIDRATCCCRKFTVCCGYLNLKSVGTVLVLLSGSNDRGRKLLLRISMADYSPTNSARGWLQDQSSSHLKLDSGKRETDMYGRCGRRVLRGFGTFHGL